jgi:hypothetical protein
MGAALLPSRQWRTFAVAASNPHRVICPFRTFGLFTAKPISAGILTSSSCSTKKQRAFVLLSHGQKHCGLLDVREALAGKCRY